MADRLTENSSEEDDPHHPNSYQRYLKYFSSHDYRSHDHDDLTRWCKDNLRHWGWGQTIVLFKCFIILFRLLGRRRQWRCSLINRLCGDWRRRGRTRTQISTLLIYIWMLKRNFIVFNTICWRLVEFKYLPGDEAVVESSFEVDLHSDLLFLDVQLRVILLALFLRYLNLRVAENKIVENWSNTEWKFISYIFFCS